ncbi:ORC ubiquitin ligase 1 [Spea bombifrons]|uniref:ORC ubiquitin ligase 1 n=1 Tax=Spea bombifrons TaxID=233779 RepID=UPI00234991FD|nr:ORC ubiquitin ligase 1 [Spea bombifrons]
MAQNVQNVTLALTLPITCHICLGKVRQPVICANHHVFCSSCIELWLKNNSQCPACRVPITPENPCRDVIGGTGENECILSHSVRKHLRKTRLELLHKEYEDEIETHLKEIEELKKANSNLEEKLNEHVCDVRSASEISELEDNSSVDARTLEEFSKKLQAANEVIGKVTGDLEKLIEENKRLKNENFEFGRENLRLKVEVENRSPQKFGRFTVAALQAKVDQYEREMNRLRKALERSDQYIEELEGQIEQLKPAREEENGRSNCEGSLLTEGNIQTKVTGTALNWQEEKLSEVSLNQAQRSHKKIDPGDTHGSPTTSNGYVPTSNQGTYVAKSDFSSNLPNQTCSKLNGDNVIWKRPLQKTDGGKNETCTPSKEKNLCDFGSPSTSLVQFGSLQLSTPDSKVSCTQTSIKKPLTYLRKLVFDDFRKKSGPDSFVPGIKESASRIEESLIKDQYEEPRVKESNSRFSQNCTGNDDSQKQPHMFHQEQLLEPVTNRPNQFLLKKYPNVSDISHSRVRSVNSMDASFVANIMPDLENCNRTMHANKTYQVSSTKDSTKLQHNYERKNEAQNSEPQTCYSDPLKPHTSVTDLGEQKDNSLQNFMFCPFKYNTDNISSSSLTDETTHFTSSHTPHNCNSCSPAAKRKLLSLDTHSPSKAL